jgi:integrase
MAKLTTKSVENIKPGPTRREIPDGGCRGLYLVVHPTGRKSWAVRYRFDGTPKKLTLDNVLTLAAARKAATDALHRLEQGADPAAQKSAAKAIAERAAIERNADTVDNLSELFIERHAKKKTRKNSWRQTEHIFRNIVLPVWSGRLIHDIKRRDIIDLIEGVAEDRPVMANRTLAALSKFFNFLASRDVTVASPCAGVARPSEERPRERVLDGPEIKAMWEACDAVGTPVGPWVRMLLLLGQRRSEVAGMRRSEIVGDTWTVPAARMKGKEPHTLPLPTQALAIIEHVPRIGDSDLVFTTPNRMPLSNFDRAKRELDARMQPRTPFVFHDLRRTMASGMAGLGIRVEVVEKILAHRSGTFRGIVGVYQRHTFIPEMRDALQRWADHLDEMVHGKPAGKVAHARFGR